MTDGEVRKVDLDAGKVTLKHAEVKSLDMPAMTMVFVVKNRSALERLKAGDKVKFKAINDAGKYTVTEIESASEYIASKITRSAARKNSTKRSVCSVSASGCSESVE